MIEFNFSHAKGFSSLLYYFKENKFYKRDLIMEFKNN